MDELPPPYVHQTPKRDNYVFAIFSVIAGLSSLGAWLLPIFGPPIALIGLALGIFGLDSSRRGIAITGIVVSIIGLVLVIANGPISAYL